MSDFIIDTAWHKRWWLPDRVHTINSVIHGDSLMITIWHEGKNKIVLSLPVIDLNNPQWEYLADTAQALAERKFGKTRQQRQRDDYARSYR